MYARMKRVKHGEKIYEYLQVVESRRVNGEPRQKPSTRSGGSRGRTRARCSRSPTR